MSFTISGDEAYETYINSNLKKDGIKSASFETIEAILKKKGVKIRTKPSDSVRFLLLPSARSFVLARSGLQLIIIVCRDYVFGEFGEAMKDFWQLLIFNVFYVHIANN